MNDKEFNVKGLELFHLLAVNDIVKQNILSKEDDLLLGEVCIGSFQIPDGQYLVSGEKDIFDNWITLKAIIQDKEIRLNVDNYKKVKNLSDELISIDFFENITNYEFIELSIRSWLIFCFVNGTQHFDLITYIKKLIESETDDYTFYFRIIGLVIEEDFSVGNCKIKHLNKNHFESLYDLQYKETIDPPSKEDFISLYEEFINKILITTDILKKTKEKAIVYAKQEVQLSVSAIKCMLWFESLKPGNDLFDVDFNYMNENFSLFLSASTSDRFYTSHLSRKNRASPIKIDKHKLMYINHHGLHKLSDFLKNKKDTELYETVRLAIISFGSINSIINLHSRIVKLISFFEAIVVPIKKGKAEGATQLKKALQKLPTEDNDTTRAVINRIYDVRNKYLHNGILMRIEYPDLVLIKKIAFELLMYIVEFSNDHTNLDDLHSHFGINLK